MRSYSRIYRAIQEHPWAIWPGALELLLEIVDRRVAGADLSAEEKAERIAAARGQAPPPVAAAPGVGVLPIYGVLSHRAYLLQDVSSSGTSTEALSRAFRAMVADPGVGAIVLDIDSPGGSVFGTQELGDEIFAARGRKPIIAVASSMAASAAYWIGSQADELVVTPGGQVGSLGVIAVHDDASAFAEKEGFKRTFITFGRYKAEGHPFAPLDDEARAEIQRMVDGYGEAFVKSVARGRNMSPKVVRGEQFGEGRMFRAEAAVANGLADRVDTLDQTIAKVAARLQKRSSRGASAELEEARIRVELAELGPG